MLPARPWTHSLERLLMAIAVLSLGICSGAWLDTLLYRVVQSGRLEAILGREAVSSSRLSGGWKAAATRREVAASGLIRRLDFTELRAQSIVAEGADPLTLHRALGHVPGTALPGEPGNVVIAGHREAFFSNLNRMRSGDRVTLTTPDGEFTYSVDSRRVVTPEQTEVLAATSIPTLTLITCYPFHYLGPAPERYVVRARQVAKAGKP